MGKKAHIICAKCGEAENIGFTYSPPVTEDCGVGVSISCGNCAELTCVEEWNEFNGRPLFKYDKSSQKRPPLRSRRPDKNGHLVLNRMKTPDGTVLISKHRHDYVTHVDAISGEEYMLDGGTDCQRHSVNIAPMVDMSVYSNDPHEYVREGFYWGTRGVCGTKPVEYKPLNELSEDHIKAILDTQYQLSQWRKDVFKNELKFREEGGV